MFYHQNPALTIVGVFLCHSCTKVFTKCEHFTLQNVSYNPPNLVLFDPIWRDIASYNPPNLVLFDPIWRDIASYTCPKLVILHPIWRDIPSYNPPKVGKSGR